MKKILLLWVTVAWLAAHGYVVHYHGFVGSHSTPHHATR